VTGSANGEFGRAPVGSSVQPCPLGLVHVDIALPDGGPVDVPVRVKLTGPDSASGSVPAGSATWTSPKIRPGTYLVEVAPARGGNAYQPVPPATCELPESGVVSAALRLEPYASVAVVVCRQGTGEALSGITVRLDGPSGRIDAPTGPDGVASFDCLETIAPHRLELDFGDRATSFEPFEPITLTLAPGPNDKVSVEVAGRGQIAAVAVAEENGARHELAIRVTIEPEDGSPITAASEGHSTTVVMAGLSAGRYAVRAEPIDPAEQYYSIAPATLTLARGESRTVELAATRERSRIVTADRAGDTTGLLRDLGLTPYPQARDQVRGVPAQRATFTLPFPTLAFDDVPFEAEAVYTDDGLETIAVTGYVEACGVRRELLFAHTYRPNRVVLALKFREWKFDREWGVFQWGELAKHCDLSSGFLVLSASETEMKSAYLPLAVQSFFGDESLDLKQGINLYGKLDVNGFPALRALLGWMGVSETYVKLQGYLAHDANLVFSKEAREKKQPQEKVWDLALSASIPAPTGRWPSGMVKAREITLEVGAKREQKGRSPFLGRILDRAPSSSSSSASAAPKGNGGGPTKAVAETGPATPPKTTLSDKTDKPELEPTSPEELDGAEPAEPQEDWDTEVKLRVKVEDEVTMPFVHLSRPWLASSLNQEDDEIKFSGAFQVEAGLEKLDGQAKLGESEVTLEYGTSFKLNLISDQVAAVHDLKVEINATKHTLKLAGALDLGRREKVAAVEIERAIPGSRPPAKPSETGGSTPAPAPAPSPAPAPAPSAEPGAGPGKTSGEGKKKHWWDDCTVTIKVKPGLAVGAFDLIKDAATQLAARRQGAP
jgi:hypothetical protein